MGWLKKIIQSGVLLFAALCFTQSVFAQRVIHGRVTDLETGEPLPEAVIYVKKTRDNTTTSFDGYYTLTVKPEADTIVASYIGYKKVHIPLTGDPDQQIDFRMKLQQEREVNITKKENPAFAVLRNVVKYKDQNNREGLDAYEYKSYVRTELSINQISDKFKEKKVMQEITKAVDSSRLAVGDDGNLIIPFFVSEITSHYYFRKHPTLKKEYINAAQVKGVGVDDGSVVSQLLGTTYQDYNFYNNYIKVVNKDFISPITDQWNAFYEYRLTDSSYVGGEMCYKLEFWPKHPQDLAFKGVMWITTKDYALKKIDAYVGKDANINYLEQVRITQELKRTEAGYWLPMRIRILVDIADLGNDTPGILAKFYTYNSDIVVNTPKEEKFYQNGIEVAEDAYIKDEEFWHNQRPDSITAEQRQMYAMIDTIKNIPIIKTYTKALTFIATGYYEVGKIDVGPWLLAYAWNNIEGHRVRLGFRTNEHFSRKWVFKFYGAYGTRDEYFKYATSLSYIFSRKHFTEGGVEHKYDIDQVAVNSEQLTDNLIFLAATRWLTLRGPYYNRQTKVWLQRELFRGFNQKVQLRTWAFDPVFPFAYYSEPGSATSALETDIQVTELTLESRFTKDEQWIWNDNNRVSLGTKGWPIFTVSYTRGIKGMMGGQFNYDKLSLMVSQSFRVGSLGRSFYDFKVGKIFGTLPYPLLEVHIGNESPFYTTAAFNLMNYYEFISDEYMAIRYRHYFEGLFFNRIPGIKKLKWRFLVSTNAVWGNMNGPNINLISPVDGNGNETPTFYSLAPKPYWEVGYGIENIFKIGRIDFFHRLTYLDHPGISRFGVKFSVQLML